ncbi:DUF6056 family protein [Bradyrhizobium cenepequi]
MEHFIVAARPRSVAGRVRLILWCLASLVPLLFLLRLFLLTLYIGPEHDDFCFAYMNIESGFLKTLSVFYQAIGGRVVPLSLIQLPAAASSSTGIDIFMCYVATMAALELAALASLGFLMSRAWPSASLPQLVCLTAGFGAAIVSAAPSVRDLLYWLPGVACYTVPSMIVIIVLGELVRALENGSRISTPATWAMAAMGFVAAMCNEFTPIWLLIMIVGSLSVRWIWEQPLQLKEHAIIAGAIIAGLAIVLVAPGNNVRMGQLPLAGFFFQSLREALVVFLLDLSRSFREPAIIAWLVVVALFALVQPAANVPARNRVILGCGVAILCLVCGYFAYFAHQFGTGIRMVDRAQNEALILIFFSQTISVLLFVRAFREQLRQWLTPGFAKASLAAAVIPVGIALLAAVPMFFGKTANLLRSEGAYFHAYWLESIERHARLTLSTERNLTVQKHQVTPTLLMSSDVTHDPGRLPNDCIARFYKKDSVIAGPVVR